MTSTTWIHLHDNLPWSIQSATKMCLEHFKRVFIELFKLVFSISASYFIAIFKKCQIEVNKELKALISWYFEQFL
jgi:hypothetical protein